MKELVVGSNEAGQRMEKLLKKYLREASTGFLYKMIRKKNITLNGKKAEGKELLKEGDKIQIFFSEETLKKFMGNSTIALEEKEQQEIKKMSVLENKSLEYLKAYSAFKGITIIFENEHLMLVNKPRGILSQKAEKKDLSLNEWFIGYLLKEGKITEVQLETYRPSICNRLDRNTSGLVICGKSLFGTKLVNQWIKERKIEKYYRCFLMGKLKESLELKGYLSKDEKHNKVTISTQKTEQSTFIETHITPLAFTSQLTYAEVELITGKTHQIRAHLSSIGHPLLGDKKYGGSYGEGEEKNENQPRGQLLHSYRIVFPTTKELPDLSQKEYRAEEPDYFLKLKKQLL